MITTTISSKNQVTIPTFLLQLLCLKKGDKLLLEIENKQLLMKPVGKSLVDSLIGSLTVSASKKNIPFATVLKQTKAKVSTKLVQA